MIGEDAIVGNHETRTEKKGKTKENSSGASRSWLKDQELDCCNFFFGGGGTNFFPCTWCLNVAWLIDF